MAEYSHPECTLFVIPVRGYQCNAFAITETFACGKLRSNLE